MRAEQEWRALECEHGQLRRSCQLCELKAERDAQADGWRECAAQYARNEDFYRGIVCQIGELFGEEARTSDDGSVQEDVLALKVPELVEALAAHVERLRKATLDAIHYLPGGEIKAELRDAYDDTPETSLNRRDLLKQAEALDEASNEFEVHERARMVLHWKAQKIRRQAEENAK